MAQNYCRSFFNTLDIYHKTFPLRIFGKENYKTKSGSILGIFAIIVIIAFSGIFLLDLFMRKNVMVVYNRNSSQIPEIDLTNTAIMFIVTDKLGKKIPMEGVYNLEVKLLEYTQDEKINRRLISSDIKFETCNYKKHSSEFGDMLTTLQYNEFFCISPGEQKKKLYGKLGDWPNGFSLLGIYVNRCDPKKEKCKNNQEIDFLLSDFVVGMVYWSYNIDHYNYQSPNLLKIENNGVFPMSYSLLKCYFYNLVQVLYETDHGFIFENKSKKDFYQFESQTVDVNMPGITTDSNFASNSTLGYILFKCSENVSFYYRSYGKVQNVLADIGGLIKAVLIISKLIYDFFTRKFIIYELANRFFEISNEKAEILVENKKKLFLKHNKKKELEFKSFSVSNPRIANNEYNSSKVNL